MNRVSQFPASENGAQPAQASEQKIQRETILEFLKVYGFTKTLSEAEQNQFIQTALAGNLDPFKRELHIAVYGEGENRKVSILTGYQVYLKRAERTGNLDGWRAWLEGSGEQMKAVGGIFREDWAHSFTHGVYWEGTDQRKKDGKPTQFWAKQPRFQLRKVAIAQGFRLAFPDELGSLPYDSAELPDNEAMAQNFANSVKTSAGSMTAETPVNAENVKTSVPNAASDLAEQALEDEQSPVSTDGNDDGDDFLIKAVRRIEGMFEAHPEDFTKKHQAWILDKVYKAADQAGIDKMIAYAEKVIRKSA
jgi:phage recombination protein Bet